MALPSAVILRPHLAGFGGELSRLLGTRHAPWQARASCCRVPATGLPATSVFSHVRTLSRAAAGCIGSRGLADMQVYLLFSLRAPSDACGPDA